MKSARFAPYNHGVSLTKIDLHAVMVGIEDVLPPRPVVAEPVHGLRKSAPKILAGRLPISETRLSVSTLRQDSAAPPIRADCSDEHGRSADPRAVAAQLSKQRLVLPRGGDEDSLEVGERQGGSQALDHRLAEDRQELLGRHAGDGGEQGTCSPAPQCPPSSGRQPPLDNGWHGVSASVFVRD